MSYIFANDNMMRRIEELVADGYLERDAKNPRLTVLTAKGLSVLLCVAEHPISKAALVREPEAQK